jgi:hypothetical protein
MIDALRNEPPTVKVRPFDPFCPTRRRRFTRADSPFISTLIRRTGFNSDSNKYARSAQPFLLAADCTKEFRCELSFDTEISVRSLRGCLL